MPRGYWIAHVDVTDPVNYPRYLEVNKPAFAKYGGRFLVRGGTFECKEGTTRSRNVVIEFADYATARSCYSSPEYREALKFRTAAATSDVIVIEGYDGPQPGD
jgi:uncharacterized protein (DUF1330 family)